MILLKESSITGKFQSPSFSTDISLGVLYASSGGWYSNFYFRSFAQEQDFATYPLSEVDGSTKFLELFFAWHDSRSYALKKKWERKSFIYVSFSSVYKYQAQNCITRQNIHEKCCQLNRIFHSTVILIFQVNIQRNPSYLVTVNNKTELVLEVED